MRRRKFRFFDQSVMRTNSLKFLVFIILIVFAGSLFAIRSNNSFSHSSRSENPQYDPPNIIIILADDAGYADFGFMGSEDILTPNLDLIAKDGVIFTDAHVSASVCSPSRAGILTGRYQQRFGHECNLEPNQLQAFDSAQVTIAEFLSGNRYSTSIFGKWHLGEEPHQHPVANGFDYFWGFLAGGRSYFPTKEEDMLRGSTAIFENHEPSAFEGYLTDAIGAKAASYIDENASASNPFFMYLSFNAPHTPMHAKQEVIDKFGPQHDRPVYAAMLWSMDEAIGNVVKALKDQSVYENTLIFFLSDNGGAHNNGSSVGELKGWKGNQYEGGTRVPFVVSWKGQIPSGGQYSGLTSSLDIYKTIASLENNQAIEEKSLDGVDLIPYLKGKKKGNAHESLFWRKDQMASIRVNDYKYISVRDTLSVMYNLKNDIAEIKNIENTRPELADSLRKSLSEWELSLKDPLWVEPEEWNIVTKLIYRDLMLNNVPTVKKPGDLKNID